VYGACAFVYLRATFTKVRPTWHPMTCTTRANQGGERRSRGIHMVVVIVESLVARSFDCGILKGSFT
jgi:hypothetical protein